MMELSAEYVALSEGAAVFDLSSRGRVCLLGADRVKFLHGQVTNNINDLKPGEGCYAALVSAKGKIQSDLHIYLLDNEILLDFEAGLSETVRKRLEKYIIAEDVQAVDVAAQYGLLSVQGPRAAPVLAKLPWKFAIPEKLLTVTSVEDALGEIYLANCPRTGGMGYDLFVPVEAMSTVAGELEKAGARRCGWETLETGRIEAGIPRFGVDMDDTNLAPEALDARAISYAKGCYIGQEIIARIRTYGQVSKALRALRLPDVLPAWPARGEKLFVGENEMGYLTSVTASPRWKANIALGYVRKGANQIGNELMLHIAGEKVPAKIIEL